MSYQFHSGFGPGVQIHQQIWTPLRRFGPSYQAFLLASFVSYLVPNSIWKLFVDVLFIHNTTFLSKDKDKQPFRSNFAAFSVVQYTQESNAKKLLHLNY